MMRHTYIDRFGDVYYHLGPIAFLSDADHEAVKRFAAALPELRRLEADATPGPWERKHGEGMDEYFGRFIDAGPALVCDSDEGGDLVANADAKLICALRNLLAPLPQPPEEG